jgi:hypothetical protein
MEVLSIFPPPPFHIGFSPCELYLQNQLSFRIGNQDISRWEYAMYGLLSKDAIPGWTSNDLEELIGRMGTFPTKYFYSLIPCIRDCQGLSFN